MRQCKSVKIVEVDHRQEKFPEQKIVVNFRGQSVKMRKEV